MSETQDINVYTLVNDTHKKLFLDDYFLDTYPHGKENIEVFESNIDHDGDFMSGSFLNIIEEKLNLILKTIDENRGDYILWMDADIQFFRGFMNNINQKIEEQKDIVFQSEDPEGDNYNVGIQLIKCNSGTEEFYTKVLSKFKNSELNEQPIINRNVDSAKLDIGTFSNDFWCWSLGKKKLEPKTVKLHHAQCTAPMSWGSLQISSNEQKLIQFKHIREYIQRGDIETKYPTRKMKFVTVMNMRLASLLAENMKRSLKGTIIEDIYNKMQKY